MRRNGTWPRRGGWAALLAAAWWLGVALVGGGGVAAAAGGSAGSAVPAATGAAAGGAAVDPSAAVAALGTAAANTIQHVFAAALPSVVLISSLIPAQDGSGPQEEIGSGFFLNATGDILTADHVVQGAQDIFITLSGGQVVKATVLGSDIGDDLALLHIQLPAGVPAAPLPLATTTPSPGELVVAIGNPLGYVDSVTAGIVSGVGGDSRNITGLDGHPILGTIQTDAALEQGNSGGPLLDANGHVLGIVDAKDGTTIGLAIPVSVARSVLAELQVGAAIVYPWIGIDAAPIDPVGAVVAKLPVNQGVLVDDVTAGGPAAQAGLQPVTFDDNGLYQSGTILVSVDGTPLLSLSQLDRAIQHAGIGGQVTLGVWTRHGTRKVVVWPASWPGEGP